MIRLKATRRAASSEEVEAAMAGLGGSPGIYFGVDGGIPGLHPMQATLVDQPAIVLRLYGDGLQVQPLSPFGRALLRQPSLAAWAAAPLRGSGRSAIALLRGFMAALDNSPDVLLLGALPFAAHRLASGSASDEMLGLLFFPERFFRRDAAGAWQSIALALRGKAAAPDAALPPFEPCDHPVTQDAAPDPQDDLPPGGYAQMVQRALALLQDGPLVSLTLSQTYRRRVALSPVEAFRRLRDANPAPASFFVNGGGGECLLGASPDLQLVISGASVQALPVCGTVARGAGAVGEAQSLRELINEEVDAASLAVCTDALRNDLAPLCEPGSLRLADRRRPMSLATVVHAVDRLSGRLRPGCDAWDAIVATAAPVMVTGTPRAEALAAIEQLEASPRGWYGGMVVQVAGDGDALVGTILRAAAVRDGVAQVRTGGDLLADSSPEREEQESRLKTRSLWRAFGVEEDGGVVVATARLARKLPPAVTLRADGDAFAAGLAECLLALGVQCSSTAAVCVLAGSAPAPARRRVVAIGDAALTLLRGEGFAVRRIMPQQGHLVRCRPTSEAPMEDRREFIVARYLRGELASPLMPPGWSVWAAHEGGVPQVLAQHEKRLVCLLFRPDSLLSQPAALDLLAAALAWCAA